MKLRAELICGIRAKLETADWAQAETAERLAITQPRVCDLLNGKLSKFSLEALVNILVDTQYPPPNDYHAVCAYHLRSEMQSGQENLPGSLLLHAE